jgi:hypothetical protein
MPLLQKVVLLIMFLELLVAVPKTIGIPSAHVRTIGPTSGVRTTQMNATLVSNIRANTRIKKKTNSTLNLCNCLQSL